MQISSGPFPDKKGGQTEDQVVLRSSQDLRVPFEQPSQKDADPGRLGTDDRLALVRGAAQDLLLGTALLDMSEVGFIGLHAVFVAVAAIYLRNSNVSTQQELCQGGKGKGECLHVRTP